MPKYRTIQTVTLIRDGKVVSVAPNREVELTEAEAAALGDKVSSPQETVTMFPNGAPIIPAGFVPDRPVDEVDAKSLVSSLPQPKADPKK